MGGLDERGLAAKVGASALTLGGLIKHLAFVEDLKFTTMLLGEDLVAPWNAVDWENDAPWPWHSAADDSPAALYRLWHDAVGRAEPPLGIQIDDTPSSRSTASTVRVELVTC